MNIPRINRSTIVVKQNFSTQIGVFKCLNQILIKSWIAIPSIFVLAAYLRKLLRFLFTSCINILTLLSVDRHSYFFDGYFTILLRTYDSFIIFQPELLSWLLTDSIFFLDLWWINFLCHGSYLFLSCCISQN